MAITAKNVIDRCRRMLPDTGPVFKWLDDELIMYINDGIKEILKLRPEAIFTSGITFPITEPSEISATTDTLTLADNFLPVIANYVMYRANTKNQEYANAERAGHYLNEFKHGCNT